MKKIVNIALWFLLIAGSGILLGFVVSKQNKTVCWKVDLNVDRQDQIFFVDEDLVRTQISDAFNGLEGKTMNAIDLSAVRNLIMANPGVKEATINANLDGRLQIDIIQRQPVCRVIASHGAGYYLDEDGLGMPLSTRYSARTPVFHGHIHVGPEAFSGQFNAQYDAINPISSGIVVISNYLRNHPFWLSQVDQVWVNDAGEFIVIPRVGNHEIILGSALDIEQKFDKLKAFYASTINKTDLNQYTTLNLKYRDQVVCTKRGY